MPYIAIWLCKLESMVVHPPPFQIQNGSRQWCPLSPLLFSLMMESLTNALGSNDSTYGIAGSSQKHTLSLFAGDLSWYASNTRAELPVILCEFKVFGALRNCNVNVLKLEILTLAEITDLQSSIMVAFHYGGSLLAYRLCRKGHHQWCFIKTSYYIKSHIYSSSNSLLCCLCDVYPFGWRPDALLPSICYFLGKHWEGIFILWTVIGLCCWLSRFQKHHWSRGAEPTL